MGSNEPGGMNVEVKYEIFKILICRCEISKLLYDPHSY